MTKKSGWFKHWNDSYEGDSFRTLMHDKEYLIGNIYWAMIGRANKYGSGNFEELISYFCAILHLRPTNFLTKCNLIQNYFPGFTIEINGNKLKIFIPNYSKYQPSWGGKRNSNSSQDDLQKGTDEKMIRREDDKMKRVKGSSATPFTHPTSLFEFKNLFEQEMLDYWLTCYPDPPWIEDQIRQCFGYFYIEKRKSPSASIKGWTARMSNWLKRGWESRATYGPAKPKGHFY